MSSYTDSLSQLKYDTWIEIRRDRLKRNLQALKRHSAPFAGVMAIVKANAYGHGLLEIARTLTESEAVEYLGVSSIQEALNLKEHGVETPIFLFGRLFPEEIPAVLVNGLTLSCSSLEEALEISRLSESLSRKTPIHVKVDTGMGRLGIPHERALMDIEKISTLRGILLEGIYTHFPTAERED
ncbi:MAG: alanine racemase, partial [Candidatus Omnitrophica bacterium]|nr:alanine racemase [Candidatus Omnitrophota bacterium]